MREIHVGQSLVEKQSYNQYRFFWNTKHHLATGCGTKLSNVLSVEVFNLSFGETRGRRGEQSSEAIFPVMARVRRLAYPRGQVGIKLP